MPEIIHRSHCDASMHLLARGKQRGYWFNISLLTSLVSKLGSRQGRHLFYHEMTSVEFASFDNGWHWLLLGSILWQCFAVFE